ncbi:IS5 family transposase [Microbacterium testaceum]|uniref:IS5 family transposase n=1 Tax=Microbacterium testaceum TaxID=2033 RepID=UPI001D1780BB|nr:IS5 family transposase [Microbacterium testaceum]MCC4247884.1 IS5 family transposase [Microbacterium testaceum]
MSRTQVLSDVAWARIEPLMPKASPKGGRPFSDHRPIVEGIIWRFRTGSPWRDVPAEFGPWQTVWRRHSELSKDGTWDRIHAELLADADTAGELVWDVSVDSTVNRAHQHATNLPRDTGAESNYRNPREEPPDHAIGRSRGGLSTKIHHLVDGKGGPLVVLVGPGQAGDAPMFPILMSHLRVARRGPGRPRTRPDRVRGDKAYSSRAIRQHLRDRDIVSVIPEPSDQQGHRKRRGSRGGRPVTYDRHDYKGRNVVERGFNEDKQWRGLATRYDKLARNYRGGAVLRAITIWLKRL